MNCPLNDSPSGFRRRSENESVCKSCFLTIRADENTALEDVEDIHADVCLMKADSAAPHEPL